MFIVDSSEKLEKLWAQGSSRTVLPCGVASQNEKGGNIFTIRDCGEFSSEHFPVRESQTPGWDQELQAWSNSTGAPAWFPIEPR